MDDPDPKRLRVADAPDADAPPEAPRRGASPSRKEKKRYRVIVYLYGHNEQKDGIAVTIKCSPPSQGHLDFHDSLKLDPCDTRIHDEYSIHELAGEFPHMCASTGAFSAGLVDTIAKGLNATVTSLAYRSPEFAAAALAEDPHAGELDDEGLHEPGRRDDGPRVTYIAGPSVYWGPARVRRID